MDFNLLYLNKKYMMQALFLGTMAVTAGDATGRDLVITPRQTEGPFYPDRFMGDTDNDLLVINNSKIKASGPIVHLYGKVTDSKSNPVDNAIIEIWQSDSNMVYIHSGSPDQDKRDKNFQGFGRFITSPSGEYYFRTIMPVSYTMGGITRAPHIHFIVVVNGKRMLTTQMYIKGNPLNDRDIVLQAIKSRDQREAVQPECVPKKDKNNEYSVNFNIVLGTTPEEPEEDHMRNLDGKIFK